MADVSFSLVVPCYNESENLAKLADRCRLLLAERQDVEVVLVDNGSSDRTPEILRELLVDRENERLRSIRVEVNQGYGFGILRGLEACDGSVLGWTHADLQTDPMDFLQAISLFDDARDSARTLVKGSRYGRPLRDVIFTWGMSLFEGVILGVRMWDINAQPTMFSREFFLSWESPPNDFSLDLFVYHAAVRRKLEIKRFPVLFGPRLSGEGHNEALSSKLKYSWRTIHFSLGLRRHLKIARGTNS